MALATFIHSPHVNADIEPFLPIVKRDEKIFTRSPPFLTICLRLLHTVHSPNQRWEAEMQRVTRRSWYDFTRMIIAMLAGMFVVACNLMIFLGALWIYFQVHLK